MWQRTVSGLACGLALSCGGALPQASHAPASTEPGTSPKAAVAHARSPSAVLARYWSFEKPPAFSLYVDLEGLLRSELFGGLVTALSDGSLVPLPAELRECLRAAAASAKELALGDELALIRFDPSGFDGLRKACTGTLLPAATTPVAGANEAYADGSTVVVVEPEVVLIGLRPTVTRALTGRERAHALPAAFTLQVPEYLAWSVSVDAPATATDAGAEGALGGVRGHGALSASASEFRVDASVDLPNSEIAAQVEAQVNAGRSNLTKLIERGRDGSGQSAADPALGDLLRGFAFERKDRHVTLAFTLRGTATEQARALGAAVAMGVYGVKKYIKNAKQAEARTLLPRMGQGYLAYFNAPADASHKGHARKLIALKAVPASVPHAAKYQSSTDDWKDWEKIGFSLAEPQYYQYEAAPARDGKSVDLIARGDLDGNGIVSEFRLRLTLDPKSRTLAAAQELDVKNPEE